MPASEPLARARAAAGTFAPLGVAERQAGGYRISGSYPFGSGSAHAEFMGGAAMVLRDGEMAPFENGLPQIRAFVLPSDRVVLEGNWDVMGLRGTGSFDFEVPEQHVEQGQTFSLFESRPITGGDLYGLGPVALGTISSTAWAVGVARRALHEIAEIARAGRTRMGSTPLREQQTFQREFGVHRTALRAARLLAANAYAEAVALVAGGASAEQRAAAIRETRAASSWVTRVARDAASFAWQASGSQGIRNPSRLQRCFRDALVGTGHLVFDDRNFDEVAKPSLGLDPAPF